MTQKTMACALIFFEIMILASSRSNIVRFDVPRGFYNVLAALFFVLLLIPSFLSRYTPLERWWQGLEDGFGKLISAPWKSALVKLLLMIVIGIVLLPALELMFDNPVRCHGSDMLPLIRQAGETILSGRSPFNSGYCPWGIPLIYFPAQILAYLPAIALHLDLRILTLAYFVLVLLVVYHVRNSSGQPLSAAICVLLLATSGLLQFFLSFIQLFPYLLLLTLLFAATLNRRVALAAFFAGMLLVFRQTFWFVFPLFVMLCIKDKCKIKKSEGLSFAAGILLGSLPYVFFTRGFLQELPRMARHFSQLLAVDLFQKNSLGLLWYFPGNRWPLVVLQLAAVALLYFLAWRKLSHANLWLFFSLIYFSVVICTGYNRAEEYYLLPLLVAAAFLGHERAPALKKRIFPARSASVVLGLTLAVALSVPGVSSRQKGIFTDAYWQEANHHEGRRGQGILDLNWQVNVRQRLALPEALRLVVDSPEFNAKPAAYNLSLDLNEKNIHCSTIRGRLYEVEIPTEKLISGLAVGANLLEIQIQPETPFRLKIIPLRQR